MYGLEGIKAANNNQVARERRFAKLRMEGRLAPLPPAAVTPPPARRPGKRRNVLAAVAAGALEHGTGF